MMRIFIFTIFGIAVGIIYAICFGGPVETFQDFTVRMQCHQLGISKPIYEKLGLYHNAYWLCKDNFIYVEEFVPEKR